MTTIATLIPLLPLLGFLSILILPHRPGTDRPGWIATAAVGGSFAATVVTFVGVLGHEIGRAHV